MCSVCIAKRVHVPKYMHFPTTGYARVLLFMFIRRELGGTGTGCLFQFTYCGVVSSSKRTGSTQSSMGPS